MSVASMGTTRVGSVGFAPVRGLHGLRPAPGYLVTRAPDSRSMAALLAGHRAPVGPTVDRQGKPSAPHLLLVVEGHTRHVLGMHSG